MPSRIHTHAAILAGVVFLLLDQLLKYIARTPPRAAAYISSTWQLGWEYFENYGIAFGIPAPSGLIIILTPLILLGLLILFERRHTKTLAFLFGVYCIASGALSNFIDRVLFGFTIDYLRVFTAMINLADVLIIIGLTLLAYDEMRLRETAE